MIKFWHLSVLIVIYANKFIPQFIKSITSLYLFAPQKIYLEAFTNTQEYNVSVRPDQWKQRQT